MPDARELCAGVSNPRPAAPSRSASDNLRRSAEKEAHPFIPAICPAAPQSPKYSFVAADVSRLIIPPRTLRPDILQHCVPHLINTLLQQGDKRSRREFNRFNGFSGGITGRPVAQRKSSSPPAPCLAFSPSSKSPVPPPLKSPICHAPSFSSLPFLLSPPVVCGPWSVVYSPISDFCFPTRPTSPTLGPPFPHPQPSISR